MKERPKAALANYEKAIKPLTWKVFDFFYIGFILLYVGWVGTRITWAVSAPSLPGKAAIASEPIVSPLVYISPTPAPVDRRVVNLKKFLVSRSSPLSDYASLIVNQADTHDIGWTRIVAIAGIESQYGTLIKEGSHNAWGIGGSKLYMFDSWEDGIRYTSDLLARRYQTNELKGIKAQYCPASDGCNPRWVEIVKANSEAILSIK